MHRLPSCWQGPYKRDKLVLRKKWQWTGGFLSDFPKPTSLRPFRHKGPSEDVPPLPWAGSTPRSQTPASGYLQSPPPGGTGVRRAWGEGCGRRFRAGPGAGRSGVPPAPVRGAEWTGSFPAARPQPGGSPPPSFLCLSWPFPDAGGTRAWGLGLGGILPVLQRVGSPWPACDLGQWWLLPIRLRRPDRFGVWRFGEAG